MTNRRLFTVLALVFALALVALPVAADTAAAPDPGTGSTTTYLVNKTANQASVSVFYYDQAGNSINGPSPVIPGNGDVVIDPASSQLPQGFNGAGVASSNQPLAAVVQTDYTGGPGDGYQAGAYAGVSQGSSKICFPSLWKWSSSVNQQSAFAVQNTGTSAAAVQIAYIGRDGVSQGTFNDNIPVGAQHTYDLGAPGGAMPNLPAGWAGAASVTVTNGGTVAGVGTTDYAGRYTDYNASDCANVTGATNLVVPSQYRVWDGTAANKSWKIWSAINIQNLSGDTATVQVVYTPRDPAKPVVTLNKTIAPNSAIGLNTRSSPDNPAGAFDPMDVTNSWDGTAKVTSDKPVVGTVITQWNRGGTEIDGAFYSAIIDTAGATTWFAPNVKRIQSSGQWTKISATTIQNLGNASADVTVSYYNSAGTKVLEFANESVAAGAGISFNTRDGGAGHPASAMDPLGTSFVGHVKVVSNNGQPLAVTMNGVQRLPYGSTATNGIPQ